MEEGDEHLAIASPEFNPSLTNKKTKRNIIKNLLVICVGFQLLFVAYNALSMLQSTLNQKQGIGVASQAITYAGFCISALLLPKYAIKKLGCKRALVLSMSGYVPYIAANVYFNWLTMIPTSILVGLNASLLWSSQCTYFNESAATYSKLCLKDSKGKREKTKNSFKEKCSYEKSNNTRTGNTENEVKTDKLDILCAKRLENRPNNKLNCNITFANKGPEKEKPDAYEKDTCEKIVNIFNSKDSSVEKDKVPPKLLISDLEAYSKLVSSVTARFFGLFGLIFRASDIFGNLISYYILNDNSFVLDNVTDNGTCICGSAFCNMEDSDCFSHNLAEPTQQMRNILSGVLVIVAFLGVILVFFFLDELEENRQPVKFSFNFAMATCKFIRKKEALLLIPLSSYIGLQQGFYIGDFTKSYIACAWGVYHVGLVTICYGVVGGIFSTLAGLMVKYVGRIPVMTFGAVVNAAICLYLLIWIPIPDQTWKFFISAAAWGASTGVLWSQLRAFYGVLFKKDEEAAFGGFYLWDSIGYCIAFSLSNYVCTYIKLYLLLAVSTIGMIGYFKTEAIRKQQMAESTAN